MQNLKLLPEKLLNNKGIKKVFIFIYCLLAVSLNLSSQTGSTTCGTATPLTVNGTCGSGKINAGVSAGSTPSVCGTAVLGDHWFVFTTLNSSSTTTITASGYAGSGRNIAIQLLTACPATTIACENSYGVGTSTETMTINLTPSTTYYLRIVNLSVSIGAFLDYNNVCVTQLLEMDDPLGAIPLTVDAGVCNTNGFDNTLASLSSCAPSPLCGNLGAGSKDIWFKIVVPPSGDFFIQTFGAYVGPGSGFDNFAMAVYSSSVCGSASILGCSDGSPNGIIDPITSLPYVDPPASMPSLNITGASPGSTVYLRVWNEDGSSPGYFDICVNDMGPCGGLVNNDFCEHPISINTTGAVGTDVAYNTSGISYTYDSPGDLENVTNLGGCVWPSDNSWYSFVATSNDNLNGLSIPFELDAGTCSGLETAIYEISHTPEGCCKNFSVLDNCDGTNYDPITDNTFTLTISAGSLTAGNTYYLMVNNFESTCSFSITGWSISGTLPVEFTSFKATNNGNNNLIEWITSSEKNVNTYTIEHSEDAILFTPISKINALNKDKSQKYSIVDQNPFEDLTYYRIKLTDNNGKEKYSNIISVNLKSLYENIYNIHPNPTNSDLYFEYYSKYNGQIDVELISYAGAVSLKQNNILEEGKNNITIPMSKLEDGVYILKVTSQKTGKTTYHKVVKN